MVLPTIQDPNPYGPLSEESLRKLERKIGVMLPPDYREFLRRYNGGRPEPDGFWIEKGSYSSGVHQFYGLHDGPAWLSIDTYAGPERYGVPEGLLPIGDDGIGNFICIGLVGEGRGAIYFIDHEIHPYAEPDSFEGVTEVAGSFSEFLSRLQKLSE